MINFDKMKKKLENLKNGSKGGKTGFWRVPEGESTARMVPDVDGDPIKEYWLHYNVGKSNGFLCPKKSFNQECPVCKFAFQLWKDGGDNQELAKKLFPKQRFYSAVLVRGEEDKGIRWWSYAKTVSEELLGMVNDPDYGDITDLEKGFDIKVVCKTTKGKKFPDTHVSARRLSSKFCDDMESEKCQELLKSVQPIEAMLDKKTYKEIEDLIEEAFLSSDDEPEEEGKEDLEKFGATEKEVPKKKEEKELNIDEAFRELEELAESEN